MKLKEIRKAKGISQEQAAVDLGISVRALQNYEYGQREPNVAMIIKLAKYYNVTADYLLDLEPAPDPFAEMKLDPNDEKAVIDRYMSFPPEIRAMLLDVLRKLADSAKPEESPPDIVETTTVGAVLDRRAKSEAEAEQDGVA